MENLPLFREQVLEQKKLASIGSIALIRPVSFSFISAFFAVWLLAFALIAYFGTYTETTVASGLVTPVGGMIKVVSTQAGTVSEIHVNEGQKVHKGDVLCIISLEKSSVSNGESTSAISKDLMLRRDSFRSELAQQESISNRLSESLEDKISSLKIEISQLDSEIEMQNRRVELAQDAVNQYKSLEAAKFSSPMQTRQKEDDLLDKQSTKESLVRTKTGLQQDLASAIRDLQDIPVKKQKENANSQRGIASIDQELVENDLNGKVAILAPQDGTISSMLAVNGQAIQSEGTLLDMVPNNPVWEVQLFSPSKSIGFIQEGEKVLLRYQAFPFQKFGLYSSKITSVSLSPLLPTEAPTIASAKSNEPLYRITVRLDRQSVSAYGKNFPLRAGMQVEGDIKGDERRIFEWIFDPISSLRGHAGSS